MQVPDGQQDSQLMLWLKNLIRANNFSSKEIISPPSSPELLRSHRCNFIQKLKKIYESASIYNAESFFGILYDITNPELYSLACEWLRGDDLSEDSLRLLSVRNSIETEYAAKNILANFGNISTGNYPIILCFDSLDNIPVLDDGFQDLQPLFNVNTFIHNEQLKNFLVVISIITNTLRRHLDRIQPADRARVDDKIKLNSITLDVAESLWSSRLKPLYKRASEEPGSNIFPLYRQYLEEKFPGGRTNPRNVINLGFQKYQEYKKSLGSIIPISIDKIAQEIAQFRLVWRNGYNQIRNRITGVTSFSASELIKMLQEVLEALQISQVRPRLLSGNFSNYSLSYHHEDPQCIVGVVWTEDSSMNNFNHVMNACNTVIQQNLCQTLYLVRSLGVGDPKLAGYQTYRQIFRNSNCHIRPILSSVQELATYHNLVNLARNRDLVVGGRAISLNELQFLLRKSNVLQNCRLLEELGIVSRQYTDIGLDVQPIKDYLLNIVITQQYLGIIALIRNARNQFPDVNETQIDRLIDELCQENKIMILDPQEPREAQLICLVQ